jgi:lipid-binding SYLF domain-containing protein
MRRVALVILVTTASLLTTQLWAWEPNTNNKMELQVQGAILDIMKTDEGMAEWFSTAAGYAVFPRVGKGGIGIGGARGKGLVIAGDEVIGKTTMSQVTIGLQLGGQVYSEFVFFRDETALKDFKRENYEFGAHASAVAASAGAASTAAYNSGVAVFTSATSGLMLEAAVGGQKFTFEGDKD